MYFLLYGGRGVLLQSRCPPKSAWVYEDHAQGLAGGEEVDVPVPVDFKYALLACRNAQALVQVLDPLNFKNI